jgi:two-component system NarL family sensor kinase
MVILDRSIPATVRARTSAADLADQPDLYEILLDHAYRGVRVQVLLRGILVAFVGAVVLWIAPARDRVGCDSIAAIYAAWAVGVAWVAKRRSAQLVRFMWLALFVDVAALAALAVVASVSVNQSWTSDVLVNGFFMIPILTATQLRPWVSVAVTFPTVVAYLASSIAAKQANGEPWSSIVLRTGILAGICVGSILLSRVQRSRVLTIGRLVTDRNGLITGSTEPSRRTSTTVLSSTYWRHARILTRLAKQPIRLHSTGLTMH